MMPNKWNSVDEMIPLIDKYFASTEINQITLTGLCLALDTNKQTLSDYQKKKEFTHVIEIAKLRIENAYEISLRKHGRSGDIFALKNFGWVDKTELDLTEKHSKEEKTALDKLKNKSKVINFNR